MRRTANLFDQIWQPDNIRLAFHKASRGKKSHAMVRGFARNLDQHVEHISHAIRNDTFSVGRFHQFLIQDPKERVTVQSPKTEHHCDGASRTMPLFPELRPYLEKAKANAGEDDVYVVDERYRKPAMTANGWANANLRTHFLRLLKRAGVEPWPRLFHNLRASRETELVAKFPIHVVAHWLGNTPAIAMKHYLRVTETDFANAAAGNSATESNTKSGAKSGAVLAQKQAQQASAGESTLWQELPQVLIEKGGVQNVAISCNALHTPQVEVKGLEPMTSCLQSKRSPN